MKHDLEIDLSIGLVFWVVLGLLAAFITNLMTDAIWPPMVVGGIVAGCGAPLTLNWAYRRFMHRRGHTHVKKWGDL